MHEIVSVIGSVMNAIIVVASSTGSSSSDFMWPSTLVDVDVDVDVVDKETETVVEGAMSSPPGVVGVVNVVGVDVMVLVVDVSVVAVVAVKVVVVVEVTVVVVVRESVGAVDVAEVVVSAAVVVLVVDVIVVADVAAKVVVAVEGVQLSHIAGHCFRARLPRSALLHLSLYVVWHPVGSGNPLHSGCNTL